MAQRNNIFYTIPWQNIFVFKEVIVEKLVNIKTLEKYVGFRFEWSRQKLNLDCRILVTIYVLLWKIQVSIFSTETLQKDTSIWRHIGVSHTVLLRRNIWEGEPLFLGLFGVSRLFHG